METKKNQRSRDPGHGVDGQSRGHRFPVERRHVLNGEERRRWLPPEPVLQAAGIKPGDVAVDIGAGTGFWTVPLSHMVGARGTVYAVDVEPVMLEELRTLVSDTSLTNVRIVASAELNIPLPDRVADVAVAGFVVHEPADHAAFVHELVRLLKPDGRLLVVDWHKKETEKGPPVEHRLGQDDVEGLLRDTGLAVETLDAPSTDIYVVLGRLPGVGSSQAGG